MSKNSWIIIFGVGTVLFCALLGYYVVRKHQESLVARQSLINQQKIEAEIEKRRNFEAESAKEFEQFYAGKVQAYDSIMGSRNLIPNFRVRPRSDIERDFNRVFSEIEAIRSKYIRVYSNRTSGPYGTTSSSGVVYTNTYAMNQELGNKPYELEVFRAELKRDDFFAGRISGQDL
jgi:hypothetical protein